MLGLGAVISPKAKSHVLRGSLETTGNADSYISIPLLNSLFLGNHSFSTWIKLKVSNIDTTTFGYRHATKSARQEYLINIYGQNSGDNIGKIVFTQRSGLGLSTKGGASSISKSDTRAGEWYNIVVTTKSIAGGNATETKIYINGVQGSTLDGTGMTAAQKLNFNPTSKFIFGGVNVTGSANISNEFDPFSLRLSSFSAWSSTLEPNEITDIYKGGKGRKLHKNTGNYVSANQLKLDYNFNSISKNGIYKSTGLDNEEAEAVNCRFISDHPSLSTGRLQG